MAGNWFKNQYNDIKGNLKWAILYWLLLGGGMTWLAHWAQSAFHANIAGWLALAAPIFSILAVFYLLIVIQSKASSSFSPKTHVLTPLPPPPVMEELLEPEEPRSVDLRGEILQIYFHDPQQGGNFIGLVFLPAWIVCEVSIVNHGPDVVTIRGCSLEINLPDFNRNAELFDLPPNWCLRKKVQSGWGSLAAVDSPIEPILTQDEKYHKGIPQRGWLAFQFHNYGHQTFPNAQFTIHLQDSLGGSHEIRRESMAYLYDGELVLVEKNKAPVASTKTIKP